MTLSLRGRQANHCVTVVGWIDWSEEVNKLSGLEGCGFVAYDNLPIKGYSYPLKEVEEIHDLSRKVKTVNGETAICPACGYVLTEFSGEK